MSVRRRTNDRSAGVPNYVRKGKWPRLAPKYLIVAAAVPLAQACAKDKPLGIRRYVRYRAMGEPLSYTLSTHTAVVDLG
jgi:hypothetical protein